MQAFLFEIEDFSTNRRFVKGTSFIGIHSEESKILGSLLKQFRSNFETSSLFESKIRDKDKKIADLRSLSLSYPKSSIWREMPAFRMNIEISFAYRSQESSILLRKWPHFRMPLTNLRFVEKHLCFEIKK